jgi:hypothetical protein
MIKLSRAARMAALTLPLLGAVACQNFLTGGELSTDPNRVTQASTKLLFVATQPELWVELGSDLARYSSMWARQMAGVQRQYQVLYWYGITEADAGGFYAGVYSGGGLIDLRTIEAQSTAAHDSTFLGVAQVEEAMLMGTVADVFGDIVYTKAFTGANPALDGQLAVYDSLQALLNRAIVNLRASSAINAGPQGSDLVYGGSRDKWRRLAFTMKAQLAMHTAKVRPTAYAVAAAAADSGITAESGDYMAVYTGSSGEQNLWYQFDVVQRSGYIAPDPSFITFLTTGKDAVTGAARNDPRVSVYFTADGSDLADNWMGAAGGGNSPALLVTAAENLLLGAEAAYRTGNQAKALTLLNQERTTYRMPSSIAPNGYTLQPYAAGTSGAALLQAILDEKYITSFGTIEAWNDYKRNCYPNLPIVANASAATIPARLFYDLSERNTNTSIPTPSAQPLRNAADPKAATDPFGNKCLGQ